MPYFTFLDLVPPLDEVLYDIEDDVTRERHMDLKHHHTQHLHVPSKENQTLTSCHGILAVSSILTAFPTNSSTFWKSRTLALL